MMKSNGVRAPQDDNIQPRLVFLPVDVYVRVKNGEFTLEELVHGKDAMAHLSDGDILDILALNQAIPFVEKLNDSCLLSNSNPCSRVYKLNEILRVSPVRDIVANFIDQSRNNVMTHQCSTGESAIGNLLVINCTSQMVHVSCISHGLNTNLHLIAFLSAKLISGKHGYRHTVRVNGGLLYNELKQIITNHNPQDE